MLKRGHGRLEGTSSYGRAASVLAVDAVHSRRQNSAADGFADRNALADHFSRLRGRIRCDALERHGGAVRVGPAPRKCPKGCWHHARVRLSLRDCGKRCPAAESAATSMVAAEATEGAGQKT